MISRSLKPVSSLAATLVMFFGATDPAQAQPADGAPPGMKQIDEGYADLTPFSLSFRVLQLDLRLPVGFEHVYQLSPDQQPVVRAPWASTTAHRFARQSGALTVVFPQSRYVTTKKGNAAPVPADSRFIIGAIPTVPTTPPPRPVAYNAVASAATTAADRRADRASTLARLDPSRNQSAQVVATADVAEVHPSVLTSEDYRVRRVRALLQEAAQVLGAPAPADR